MAFWDSAGCIRTREHQARTRGTLFWGLARARHGQSLVRGAGGSLEFRLSGGRTSQKELGTRRFGPPLGGPGARATSHPPGGGLLQFGDREPGAGLLTAGLLGPREDRMDVVPTLAKGHPQSLDHGCNVRSTCRCSVYPAIHTTTRSLLRSSSTHEPSDPPLRVVLLVVQTP